MPPADPPPPADIGSDAPQSGQLLIYADAGLRLQVRLDGETVWLSQRQIAELFQVDPTTVGEHLGNLFADSELDPGATTRKFRVVGLEGSRQVARDVIHYNLDVIIAVGYRVRSSRGTAFRQWATARLSELLVKGFTLDDERIKAGQTLGDHYFDELLARIRDIRSSERMFYQKIIDIYATSIDYTPSADVTQKFFATVQNKLHFAAHGQTAAEIVKRRADATKPNMGLTSWKNSPDGPVRKGDVEVAKNYLTHQEIEELNRIVAMYLDFAEDQARRRSVMHMADWITRLDAFLQFNERELLVDSGKVSHALAKRHAETEYEKFEVMRMAELSAAPSPLDTLTDQASTLTPNATKATRKKKSPPQS